MNSSQTQTQTQPHLPVEPESNSRRGAFHWKRLFGEVHPYDSIVWEKEPPKLSGGMERLFLNKKTLKSPVFGPKPPLTLSLQNIFGVGLVLQNAKPALARWWIEW